MYKYKISQFSYSDYSFVEVLHDALFTELEFNYILALAESALINKKVDVTYHSIAQYLIDNNDFDYVSCCVLEINLGDNLTGEVPAPPKPKPLF